MIRMGRNSRSEPSIEPNYPSQSPESTSSNLYTNENVQSSRVVTDSESMARDIKEGRLSGFVGHGTVLTGETVFEAMLRVDGHLIGTVSSESGSLIVGTNGQVDANISVSSALVNGTVNGDIIATEKLQLGRTSRVIGNVQTPRLIIEDGAVFEGGCTMLKARENIEKRESEAKAQYNSAENGRYGYENYTEPETDEEVTTSDDESDEEKAEAALV